MIDSVKLETKDCTTYLHDKVSMKILRKEITVTVNSIN